MVKEQINTPDAPKAIGPYSQAVRCDNILYISGQIAIDPQTNSFDPDQDIETQTRRVLDNISAILKQTGMDLKDVVKSEIFLKNINNFKKVNEIYSHYFTQEPKPARQTVEVSALPLGALIEISCTAYKQKEEKEE